MKILNFAVKASIRLVSWLMISFSLFLLSLVCTGSVCCAVFVVAEALDKIIKAPIWQVWLALAFVLWVAFEVYISIQVSKALKKKK